MRQSSYHCSELNCEYKTITKSTEEVDALLIQDGGFDINKKTLCPKCKKDSLVFITSSHE